MFCVHVKVVSCIEYIIIIYTHRQKFVRQHVSSAYRVCVHRNIVGTTPRLDLSATAIVGKTGYVRKKKFVLNGMCTNWKNKL